MVANIAVVTVCYNDSLALERTIQSVADQDPRPDEYIVVDGGSTDGTDAVIFNADHVVSRWVSEKDQGIYDAMNKGLALARSDYIIFLNAGDIFYSKKTISTLKAAIASAPWPKPDVVYGDVVLAYPGKLYRRRLAAQEMTELYKMMPCSHQSVLASREILTSFPFRLDVGMIADWCQLVDIKLSGGLFLKLDSVISVFEKGGVSSVPLNRVKNHWRQYSWVRERGLLTSSDHIGWFKRILYEVVVWFVSSVAPDIRDRYLQSKFTKK